MFSCVEFCGWTRASLSPNLLTVLGSEMEEYIFFWKQGAEIIVQVGSGHANKENWRSPFMEQLAGTMSESHPHSSFHLSNNRERQLGNGSLERLSNKSKVTQ